MMGRGSLGKKESGRHGSMRAKGTAVGKPLRMMSWACAWGRPDRARWDIRKPHLSLPGHRRGSWSSQPPSRALQLLASGALLPDHSAQAGNPVWLHAPR